MRIKRRIAVFASMGDVMSRSSLVLRGACASLLLMMVAACGHSSPVSEDAAGNGSDGSNPSGSLVSSQNTFLSIVPPGSNGKSAGGIGDRKSAVEGKSVSVRVDLGGRRFMKKERTEMQTTVHITEGQENNRK